LKFKEAGSVHKQVNAKNPNKTLKIIEFSKKCLVFIFSAQFDEKPQIKQVL
jgi:hypothetical protein